MAGHTEQLDTFVTVVKTGSFTAAADQLGQATSVTVSYTHLTLPTTPYV